MRTKWTWWRSWSLRFAPCDDWKLQMSIQLIAEHNDKYFGRYVRVCISDKHERCLNDENIFALVLTVFNLSTLYRQLSYWKWLDWLSWLNWNLIALRLFFYQTAVTQRDTSIQLLIPKTASYQLWELSTAVFGQNRTKFDFDSNQGCELE